MVDPGGEMNIPMLGGTSQLTNNMHTTNHLVTNHLTRPYTIPTYNDSGQLTSSLTNDMVKDMASLNPQDVSVDTKDATLTNGNIIGITDTGMLVMLISLACWISYTKYAHVTCMHIIYQEMLMIIVRW